MNTAGKMIAAMAVGLATGAVLGILFAPDKGSETRKKMRDKQKKWVDDFGDKMKRGKEKLNELKEKLDHKETEKASEMA
jgi:gas vesicle protein